MDGNNGKPGTRRSLRSAFAERVRSVQAFRQKNAAWESALFFIAGFLFDVFTLSRIDDWVTLVQQGAYLALLGTLLLLDLRIELQIGSPPRFFARIWRFVPDVQHFLFGSLLSSFTLFYFKSASSALGLSFLAVMFLLLLANELPHFRKLGSFVRTALYALSLSSFFAFLFPVLIGRIGIWVFVIAVLASGSILFFVFDRVRVWKDRDTAIRRVGAPAGSVLLGFVLLYVIGAIPPVPLSLDFVGIYHDVKKSGGAYELLHMREDWKIWHRGDQYFEARPGDRVFVFVKIFAPKKFRERVFVRWFLKDAKRGWLAQDAIPLNVVGREHGYRGYAFKSNYQPGDWKVQVETEDGREIGYIKFEIVPDESTDLREYRIDRG